MIDQVVNETPQEVRDKIKSLADQMIALAKEVKGTVIIGYNFDGDDGAQCMTIGYGKVQQDILYSLSCQVSDTIGCNCQKCLDRREAEKATQEGLMIKHPIPKDPTMDTQGQRLRRLLDKYNKEHICKQIGYNVTSFSRVLNDRAGISDEKLQEIADFLGLPFDEVRVDKDTDKALRKLKINHVLVSDELLDSFVGAPLDAATRKWFRGILKVGKDHIDQNRDAFIAKAQRRQERIEKERQKLEEKKAQERYDQENPIIDL